MDSRTLSVSCPPEAAFDPVACIGGENGWYAFDTLWDIRGFMDLALGRSRAADAAGATSTP